MSQCERLFQRAGEREKARIYAPVEHTSGEWKELHAGIARAVHYFCGDISDRLLKMGLQTLQEVKKNMLKLFALDPHN